MIANWQSPIARPQLANSLHISLTVTHYWPLSFFARLFLLLCLSGLNMMEGMLTKTMAKVPSRTL